MKDKIMLFVIGVLVGAILTTGVFYVYTTTNSSNDFNQKTQMNGGTPPEMPSGQNGQPPEKPYGDSEPPEKPNTNNETSN